MQYVHDTEFYIINSECRSNKDKRAFRNQAKNVMLVKVDNMLLYSCGVFLGIKYKQGTIIYLFASYVVSSCSPLAVAPHSLGTQLKLTLVNSETKWFRLRTLRSS